VNSVAEYLNRLSEKEARAALLRCCSSRRWADAMLAARPFASDATVFLVAEERWWALTREDWLEAFARHPLIGGRTAEAWGRREQAGMETAAEETRAAITRGNAAYAERFGYLFLTCATGKTASEMLGELERRLANDPAVELQVAAGEQAKITRLRLEKLAAS
jgi:2-oxo-4-hydroxy-4-carboxy-5-ureidoimidazoline decarboxylase